MKRVGIYLRVSTTNGQTTENQRRELEAVAKRSGWDVVEVVEDKGISGAKGRDKRPAFDRLLKAVTAREIDMVAAWSIDRLGRSMQHLVGFLGELQAVGCDLYLHQQALDSTTPSGRAMFHMCGVFAEFERAIMRERINAGLARAKARASTARVNRCGAVGRRSTPRPNATSTSCAQREWAFSRSPGYSASAPASCSACLLNSTPRVFGARPLAARFPQFVDLYGFLRRDAGAADLGFLVEWEALAWHDAHDVVEKAAQPLCAVWLHGRRSLMH
jgi:DNA invertase Pin-like site-specific DNA recombinase